VREILSVTVDGEELDTSAYRLRRPNRLYRVDGSKWPCCQDLALEPTEEGTWEVRYIFGVRVPTIVLLGTRRLACEYLKGFVGDESCRLPLNARAITARGISVDLVKFFEESGTTGIFEVDAAIRAVNPEGLQHRATAWSPEMTDRAVRSEPEVSS
jgi:hypothetical protein